MIIRPRINLCREHYKEAVSYKRPEVQVEDLRFWEDKE